MSGVAGDRPAGVSPSLSCLTRGGRHNSEPPVGGARVSYRTGDMVVSVDPALGVVVRIYEADNTVVELAMTPTRAMHIASLFARAALRADPGVVVPEVPIP